MCQAFYVAPQFQKRIRVSKEKDPFRDLEHKHQCKFFAAIKNINHPAVELTGSTLGGFLRTPKMRIRAHAEGYRKGTLDTFTDYSSRGYYGLRMELKIKPNEPSPEQLKTVQRLREAGYAAFVVWSWQEMFATWCEYLEIQVTLGR